MCLLVSELRSTNSTGPIVGGVLGAVLSLIVVFALVLMLVLVRRKGQGKTFFQGTPVQLDLLTLIY